MINAQEFTNEQLIELAIRDGIDVRVVNGELCVEDVAGEVAEAEAAEIWKRSEALKSIVIISQQDRRDKGMDQYLKPIRIFYANLLRAGITLRVVNGTLKVGGRKDLVTPVLRAEIEKRVEHLVDLLSPEVPEPLQPYFYRLLKLEELKDAIAIAELLGASLRTTPVNGGWLIEILNRRISKEEAWR